MEKNLLSKRIIENWEKSIKVLVKIGRVLNMEHEFQNLILDLLGEFHLSHCAINKIKLFIKMSWLFIHCGHKCCHVSKDESRYNSSSNNDQRADKCLRCSSWCNFISYHCENWVIKAGYIFEPKCLIIKISFSPQRVVLSSFVIQIFGWYPRSSFLYK